MKCLPKVFIQNLQGKLGLRFRIFNRQCQSLFLNVRPLFDPPVDFEYKTEIDHRIDQFGCLVDFLNINNDDPPASRFVLRLLELSGDIDTLHHKTMRCKGRTLGIQSINDFQQCFQPLLILMTRDFRVQIGGNDLDLKDGLIRRGSDLRVPLDANRPRLLFLPTHPRGDRQSKYGKTKCHKGGFNHGFTSRYAR